MIRSTAIATALLVTGCATNPDDLPGYYVSSKKYEDHTCEEIQVEAQEISWRVRGLYGDTKRAAQTDAALMAATMVVFWPAAFFLGGNEMDEAQYSMLKGEMNALERASKLKECNIAFLQTETVK